MSALAQPMKICTDRECPGGGRAQPVGNFCRNDSAPDGLNSRCRACAARNTRRWKLANPERVRALNRNYYERNKKKNRARRGEA